MWPVPEAADLHGFACTLLQAATSACIWRQPTLKSTEGLARNFSQLWC